MPGPEYWTTGSKYKLKLGTVILQLYYPIYTSTPRRWKAFPNITQQMSKRPGDKPDT